MEILINGEVQQVNEACTVADLLDSLSLTDKRLALEVNLEIVPRSTYTEHRLNEGDRVEIVHAIGGG
jgi:sulfur carrier protein